MKKKKVLRKKIIILGIVFLVAICVSVGCGSSQNKTTADDHTLVVFNYGDYIDTETIRMFEKETGIQIEYEEYVTPEDMYTKYKSGAIDYDLICTSDYMIEKMIKENEALQIDTSKMEYYDNVGQEYLDFCKAFDPDNSYAIPYFWGTVGILYNEEMVDEEITSWSVLWNEKYKNEIVMENSMRDAFLVPLKWKGYSLNTTDKNQLLEAQKLLMKQKPLVEAYLVDESRDAMIAGDAAMAVVYSGDATVAMEANENLNYVVPEEGSNIWFDCWMIPKSAKHKKEAELFIDYMNREDIAMLNFDYIYYGTPNSEVYKLLDEETKEDESIFPVQEVMDKCEVYQYLGNEIETFYNQMWKELKSY